MTSDVTGEASPPQGSILARTALGASWVMAWRMATRILGFGSTLVLVRLLSPEDFGLVALATSFAISIEICTELGVDDQIVRTTNPTKALYHTAFTLDLLRAVVVGALVALLAGPAARWFGDLRLEDVLIALGALTALGGLSNIGVVEFRRDMQFDKEFKLLLVPRIASIAVTMLCAFLMPGHWALVLGIATAKVMRIVASYAMHPFRPRLSLSAWRELAGVSVWSWATGIAAMLRDRSDTFIIGRILGPGKVGIYAAGMEIAILPVTELLHPICRACFPGFAATAREGINIAATWRRVIGLTALFSIPAGAGLSLVAHDLIFLAYGPAWVEAVPVVVVLGLTVALTPFGGISQALLGSQTMLRTIFSIISITMVVRVGLLLVLTPRYGLLGAALAWLVSALLDEMLQVGLTMRRWQISPGSVVQLVWRPFAATAVMAALLWSTGLGWTGVPPDARTATLGLLVSVPLGVVSYIGVLSCCWLLAGRPTASAEQDVLAMATRAFNGLLLRLRAPATGKMEPGSR